MKKKKKTPSCRLDILSLFCISGIVAFDKTAEYHNSFIILIVIVEGNDNVYL